MPSWAVTNTPSLSETAPVKAPRLCPKKWDSTSSDGIAPQFTGTLDCPPRGESEWMVAAAFSLPVPDSPVIRQVLSVRATRSSILYSRCIGALSPTRWP